MTGPRSTPDRMSVSPSLSDSTRRHLCKLADQGPCDARPKPSFLSQALTLWREPTGNGLPIRTGRQGVGRKGYSRD